MCALLIYKNKKAFFDHTILERFVAGIVLKGYEVKAIKEKKVNFEGAYVKLMPLSSIEETNNPSQKRNIKTKRNLQKDILQMKNQKLSKLIPVIINMTVGKYSKQSTVPDTFDEKRTRRLLLNNSEIESLRRFFQTKGRTAVPTAVVLDHGLVKVEFAVVKSKKEFEKKVVAKEKQIAKDLERDAKDIRRTVNR